MPTPIQAPLTIHSWVGPCLRLAMRRGELIVLPICGSSGNSDVTWKNNNNSREGFWYESAPIILVSNCDENCEKFERT